MTYLVGHRYIFYKYVIERTIFGQIRDSSSRRAETAAGSNMAGDEHGVFVFIRPAHLLLRHIDPHYRLSHIHICILYSNHLRTPFSSRPMTNADADSFYYHVTGGDSQILNVKLKPQESVRTATRTLSAPSVPPHFSPLLSTHPLSSLDPSPPNPPVAPAARSCANRAA